MSDLKNFIAENTGYNNFAEEVTIISETRAGDGLSVYQVINKNGVTFQTVPGNAGIVSRGTMGFINGDRGRPIVFGPAAKVAETPTAAPDIFIEEGLIADIEDGPFTISYDINLEVWADGGACTANDIEEPFVIVKKL